MLVSVLVVSSVVRDILSVVNGDTDSDIENITKSRLLWQDGPAQDGPISSILTSDANGDLSSVSTDTQYLPIMQGRSFLFSVDCGA